jgi:putative membrane protein
MNDFPIAVPYCGLSPLPSEIGSRWNLDPVLIAALLVLFVAHVAWRKRFERGAPSGSARRASCYAGWGALAAGLVSPLCALSVALFSARVAQHMWLTLIAAPLLALSFPSAAHRAALPKLTPFTAAGVFALALWVWHWPVLYALTFTSDVAYWAMHITMTGSAIVLWQSLLDVSNEHLLARVSAGFVTLTHMGMLGALITFAPRTLYTPHLLTAPTWGLTALEDQQLGGLVMWIPSGAVFLAAALASMYAVLRSQERRSGFDPTGQVSE